MPSIIKKGILSNEKSAGLRHESIAMADVQEKRNSVHIPNGMKLHQYANLYFDPRNPMMYARKNLSHDLCILKIDREILDREGVVVSDMNAASNYASFYLPEIGLYKIDFDLVYAESWTDPDRYEYYKKKSSKCAEVLVPYRVPYEYIVSAAVVNLDTAKALEMTGFDKPVVTESRLFFGE